MKKRVLTVFLVVGIAATSFLVGLSLNRGQIDISLLWQRSLSWWPVPGDVNAALLCKACEKTANAIRDECKAECDGNNAANQVNKDWCKIGCQTYLKYVLYWDGKTITGTWW